MLGFSRSTTSRRLFRGSRDRLSVVLKGPAAHSIVNPERNEGVD